MNVQMIITEEVGDLETLKKPSRRHLHEKLTSLLHVWMVIQQLSERSLV